VAITDRNARGTFGQVVAALGSGRRPSIAFIVEPGPTWPLPLYELALLTARYAKVRNVETELTFITADPAPLPTFGEEVGQAISGLLQKAGVQLMVGSRVNTNGPQELTVKPAHVTLHLDWMVSVPRISGPNIRGIPGFAEDRFLHVDSFCRVPDTDGRIFAAGDATDLPVKHGGVGAQQADTAAAGIAHLAGVGQAPEPLRPEIRGMLVTGEDPLYLSAFLIAGQGWRGSLSEQPPWPSGQKVVAEELESYLSHASPA
jgi:sulfide:quinone oxidoreductase